MWQWLIPAMIEGGAALWGTERAKDSAEETNEKQMELAERQMQFQERMRSTAHQVEVKDLLAAGLNPILSANSGAPMAMGAMASLNVPGKDYSSFGDKVGHAIGNSISSAKTSSDIGVNRAQKNLILEQSAKATAETASANAEARIRTNEAELTGMKLQYYKDHPDVFGLKMESEGYNLGNIPAILSSSAKGLKEGKDAVRSEFHNSYPKSGLGKKRR